MTRPSVIVVGGGIAGLAAASALRAAAIEAVVVERSGSPGGRVASTVVDGTPIDFGAQFLAPYYREVLAAMRRTGLDTSLRLVGQAAMFVHGPGTWRIDGLRSLASSSLLPLRGRAGLAALAMRVMSARRRLDPHDLGAAVRSR